MPKILGISENKILDVADKILREEGYKELSVRKVANLCGIAVGTFYLYFPSKDDLVANAILRSWKKVLSATDAAARDSVDIRTYRIIYECIEEMEAAMKGMLAPKFKESVIGHAEVRQTIRVPNVGTIAGSYVTDGKIARNALIRVLRDSVVIFEDKISSLRRFKDDVREVAQSFECGIGLEKFNDIKEGDVLEAYVMEEIEQ